MPKLQRILFQDYFNPEKDTGILNEILSEIYNRLENNQDLHPPTVKVHLTADESINNNSLTTVPWDDETWDTDNMWVSTDNTKLTVRSSGLYVVGASWVWGSNVDTGERLVQILHGATVAADF